MDKDDLCREVDEKNVNLSSQQFEICHELPNKYLDSNPKWFDAYGCQKYSRANPLYKSSYMEYGWFPPNELTAPLTYHPARRSFTEHLSACGMFRNTSLNTMMDPKPWGQ